MKYLSLLLFTTLLVSCGKKTSSTTTVPPSENDPVAEPQRTTQEILVELEEKWDLETKIETILSLIEETPVSPVSFASNQTWHLSRALTDNELAAGELLTDQISAEYDEKFSNSVATDLVAAYRLNDSLYVANCSANTVPRTMQGVDGKNYKIVSSGGSYQVLNADDDSLHVGNLPSYLKACRYITSDEIGKRYAANLTDIGIRLKFPVKFKKTGGINNFGRIQSYHGTMLSDFCDRSFKETDGLDSEGYCP